jgi:hypothetical protein
MIPTSLPQKMAKITTMVYLVVVANQELFHAVDP